MKLNEITIKGGPLFQATDAEVDAMEKQLGIIFPREYREYVTTLGEGILGGDYIRIYPPWRIANELDAWHKRIEEYWFWDDRSSALTKNKVLESIIIGDTLNGDEIILHPDQPDHIFVLPRNSEIIYYSGNGLFETIDWLCSSGMLTEPFEEREFEPFNSRLA